MRKRRTQTRCVYGTKLKPNSPPPNAARLRRKRMRRDWRSSSLGFVNSTRHYGLALNLPSLSTPRTSLGTDSQVRNRRENRVVYLLRDARKNLDWASAQAKNR